MGYYSWLATSCAQSSDSVATAQPSVAGADLLAAEPVGERAVPGNSGPNSSQVLSTLRLSLLRTVSNRPVRAAG
jgi:hypothetical protein